MDQNEDRNFHPHTRLIHAGQGPFRTVATPPHRASTLLFPDYRELVATVVDPVARDRLNYGRMGTPSTRELEDAIRALDNSAGAVLAPSGLAAIADVLLCFLSPGDHVILADCCYGPTRNFCATTLAGYGIETSYLDPRASGLEDVLRPQTRLLFLESPGSATFEFLDVPALAGAARSAGVLTAMDNTWATPLLFDPLEHGVDLAIQSGTKYLNGHADCLFGVTTSRDPGLVERLFRHTIRTGSHLAPDDCYLARRGLRTLAVRLAQHGRSGIEVARWLEGRGEVVRVLHPELDTCVGNEYFRRDFRGANGLFGVVLREFPEPRLERFLDSLRLFAMGYSWGGFESLAMPMKPGRRYPWLKLGRGEALLRLHIGLENPADLMADLDAAFAVSARAL